MSSGPGGVWPNAAVAAAAEAERVVARLLREARARLEDVRTEHADLRGEAAARADERAALARAGRLGDAVRRLQESVDAGRTTWAAVLGGEDVSADAADARARATAAVTAAADARTGRRSRAPR